MKMQVLYRVFLATSLLAVIITLYRANYLVIPEIVSFSSLAGSLLLLFGGFVALAFGWKAMLNAGGCPVSTRDCIASAGMSVFGKYIPGKVWAVVGRAAYVSLHTDASVSKLSVISVRTQLIETWSALFVGSIGLYATSAFTAWGTISLTLWVMLTVVLFSPVVRIAALSFGRTILGRDLRLFSFEPKNALSSVPVFLLAWSLFAFGFYLLARSLISNEVSWTVGLVFPLGVSFGVLAIFVPGGIGVREAVLTGCLTVAGIPAAEAATLSVASRLWYLAGETMMFLLGMVADQPVKTDLLESS